MKRKEQIFSQGQAGSGSKPDPKVWLLRALVGLGILAFGYYLSWFVVDDRWRSPLLLVVLICALFYGGMQMAGNWFLYLFAHRSSAPDGGRPKHLTVDVFVTIYNEPYEMVERALGAALAMRGEHQTWLLDDGANPAMQTLAQGLGAGYLSRPDRRDAKAGNLNAALPRTNGDIIAIFDIDHVPEPDFLERSLGYFADPKIGFVQVMLTFANGCESWVAQAAIETSLEFYNPTSMGANGVGAATLMGSNALIRRTALESIGGYQPGLAEDLATSINLHAAGWKSGYVAEPLAPGLAPPSFVAWFTQQLKWARGVFELLITAYPRLYPRLTWGQRLSYCVRMTKYWIGPGIAVHLIATIVVLTFAGPQVRNAFHAYLVAIAPLAVMDAMIRHVAFRLYRHRQVQHASLARAVSLVYATWPIYTLAWLMAVLRLPLGFRPTPKDRSGRLHPAWLLPQIFALLLVFGGAVYTVVVEQHPLSLLLAFAAAQAAVQLVFLAQWLRSVPEEKTARQGAALPGPAPPILLPATGLSLKPNQPCSGISPVAVRDVDLLRLPERLDVPAGSRQAFCLVRMDGRPLGQVLLDVPAGGLNGEAVRQGIFQQADWGLWERWLHGYLGGEDAPEIKALPSASVVICTRDRPADLQRCLDALMRLPDQGQEILVVDSCSTTDETRLVASRFPGVRYVREAYPGLNRARNRAFLETQRQVLAFVDDDAMPDPGWLQALLRNFQEPNVLCVTGLTMPAELETEAQQWFEAFSTFGRGFDRLVFTHLNLHPLSAGRAGAGVNMALRREAVELVGTFDEALDAGTPTQSGGDTEMFARILAAGYHIVYEPRALSWHRHRRDWESLRKTIFGYGVGIYAFWIQRWLAHREWDVARMMLDWGLRFQLPNLVRSLLHRPATMPADLLLAEIKGCLAGPGAYRASLRRLAERANDGYQPYQKLSPG